MEKYWLGFDLGATKMMAAVYDASFREVSRDRKKTKGQKGVQPVIARIVEIVGAAIETAKIDAGQIAGIGVGVPSPVDQERGIVLEAVNLGWKDVPLAGEINREFGCPVFIVNDVDAGVYGEYRFGAGKKARTVLGVFPGTGIGGGCVYEGQIIHGKSISCMEIGHVQVTADGQLCGCGRRGCLEAEASRLAISAAAAMAAFRGQAPALLAEGGTNLTSIRSRLLAKAIEAGDEAVEDIVRRAARLLGIAVANVVHLVAPDVVVLGGGLVEAMPDLFVDSVTETANKTVMPSFVGSFKVVPAKLGDDATVMGAAAWAEKNVACT